MRFLRTLFLVVFGHYGRAGSVRGGSGHFNEQCHPQTYN